MVTSDTPPLVEALMQSFLRRQWRLAVAESCTGGRLAAAITDVPGASTFFLGGVVSYADDVKEKQLGVPKAILEAHGAVSEPTARAMAEGVRQRLLSDVGVAITGIAGPGGVTPTKPLGLVFVAVATPERTVVRQDVWPGSRAAIRHASVRRALELTLASAEGLAVA